MSILWTTPAALAGLALIALPIAAHLLARQQMRTLRYPSLRFLRQTQLASFRRRRIEDGVLLVCRVAIVAAAALALAGPALETSSRTATYADRVSRAIVISESVAAYSLAALEEGTYRSTRLQRAHLVDALLDAIRWLEAQPKSTREIVIAGTLRRGAIAAIDLALVPPGIGVRFEQTAADGPLDLPVSILTRRDERLMRVDRVVSLTTDSTRVTEGTASPVAANLLTISARPVDAVLADAALRAALDAGLPWRDFERPVALVWSGGAEPRDAGVEVVRMPIPDPPVSAADAVFAALTKFAPLWAEPLTIPPEQLDSWSRPPGAPATDAPIGGESDRRWLWAAALALLAVEWWLRRWRSDRVTAIDTRTEARVA